MTHTPTPWTIVDPYARRPIIRSMEVVTDIAAMSASMKPQDEVDANAALIVRAVNAHADLVAALQDAINVVQEALAGNHQPNRLRYFADNARAAIAKATA